MVTSRLYTEPMYPVFILLPFSEYSLDFIFFDLADPPLEKKSNPHEAGSDKVFTWWDWVASWSSNNIRFPLRFDEVLISSTCIKYRKVKCNYHYTLWFNNLLFHLKNWSVVPSVLLVGYLNFKILLRSSTQQSKPLWISLNYESARG